ncbi:MAG: hypothetical protein ACRCS9_13795 [Hyphomicrobium sp.]
MRFIRRLVAVIAALCMVPFAAVMVSALLAALLGCELNEGTVEVCSVFGVDVGGMLSGLFVTGWLALITLPLLMLVVMTWLSLEAWVEWRKRRKVRRLERASSTGTGVEEAVDAVTGEPRAKRSAMAALRHRLLRKRAV